MLRRRAKGILIGEVGIHGIIDTVVSRLVPEGENTSHSHIYPAGRILVVLLAGK